MLWSQLTPEAREEAFSRLLPAYEHMSSQIKSASEYWKIPLVFQVCIKTDRAVGMIFEIRIESDSQHVTKHVTLDEVLQARHNALISEFDRALDAMMRARMV
jgi:hypothetical protein